MRIKTTRRDGRVYDYQVGNKLFVIEPNLEGKGWKIREFFGTICGFSEYDYADTLKDAKEYCRDKCGA